MSCRRCLGPDNGLTDMCNRCERLNEWDQAREEARPCCGHPDACTDGPCGHEVARVREDLFFGDAA